MANTNEEVIVRTEPEIVNEKKNKKFKLPDGKRMLKNLGWFLAGAVTVIATSMFLGGGETKIEE